MDDIVDSESHPEFVFEHERLDLQESIIQIRVMLWANDYQAARESILELQSKHGPLIKNSLALKKRLTSIYRKSMGALRSELGRRGLKGRDLDREAQEEIAKRLHVSDDKEDALYLLAPLANMIASLDKRIAEYIGDFSVFTQEVRAIAYHPLDLQKPFIDSKSGFHLICLWIGMNQWEIRAYQFTQPKVDVSLLTQNLEKDLSVSVMNLENHHNMSELKFPLWLRGFRSDSFLEIRFYSSNRFLAAMTVKEEQSVPGLQDAILQAYAQSIV